MSLRANNGFIYKGTVKVLQAAAPEFEAMLEEIVKANKGEKYEPQELSYFPDSKAWATYTGKVAIFELDDKSEGELVAEVVKQPKAKAEPKAVETKVVEPEVKLVEVDVPHPSPKAK